MFLEQETFKFTSIKAKQSCERLWMCEDRLRDVGLFNLKKRILREIPSMSINIWKEGTKWTVLFSGAQHPDKRQWVQTRTQKVPSEHREHFYAVQMTEHWHRLPWGCAVSFLKIPKSQLDMVLGPLLWVSLLEEGVGLMDPEVSDKFSHSLILWEREKKKKGIVTIRVIIVGWEHSISWFLHLLLLVILSLTFKYTIIES